MPQNMAVVREGKQLLSYKDNYIIFSKDFSKEDDNNGGHY